MTRVQPGTLFFILVFTGILQVSPVCAEGWRSVEKILGQPGVEQGELFKITFPRTDLNVTVQGVPIEPALALTTWFAFKPMDKGTMVMGDMVLLDQEVPKVLNQLVENSFEVTAIHNHLLNETPSIKYLHVSGHGSKANLAQAIKAVLSFTGTPLHQVLEGKALQGSSPQSSFTSSPTPATTPDWSKVQAILGPGKVYGKVLQYGFPRAEAITEKGMEIPPFMGMVTSINIQKAGGMAIGEKGPFSLLAGSKSSKDVVAATGDFVLTAAEVAPVVESLTKSHIVVTAIHSHMLEESPRLFFLHFWALGSPIEVSKGLKAALDQIHLVRTK